MTAKLLFLDDETDLFHIVKNNFRTEIKNKEYEFIFAANGKEGLQKLENSGKVDLIITDLKMPEMDGSTFLRHLKQNDIHIKTIIITAYQDLLEVNKKLLSGENVNFLYKPIKYKGELKSLVEKSLNNNNSSSEPDIKYQEISKLANQLTSENKAKLIDKLIGKLEYDDLLKIRQKILREGDSYLERAKQIKEERELLKEKEHRGEINLNVPFELMEGNYIEERMINGSGPYYYLRWREAGKLKSSYLGKNDPRKEQNHVSNEFLKQESKNDVK